MEAQVGAKVLKHLRFVRDLVAPRVQAACFSTIWNRWCTPRRFKNRKSKLNVCLLGCGGLAEDSIEHYSHCKAVRTVANTYLRLGMHFTINLEHFLLAAEDLDEIPEATICLAILIYATYTSTNAIRASGAIPLSHDTAAEMLKQNCRNAVAGHASSTRVVDRRWVTDSAGDQNLGDYTRIRRS